MVTAIVRRVQAMLRDAARPDIAVEIVFPVASEAITPANPAAGALPPPTGTGRLLVAHVLKDLREANFLSLGNKCHRVSMLPAWSVLLVRGAQWMCKKGSGV